MIKLLFLFFPSIFSTTRPCYGIEFIESFFCFESFLLHIIYVYIFVYIFIMLGIFILFLLSSSVMFFLHCMLNLLRYFVKLTNRLRHSTIHQVMWYFWMFIINPFSLLCSIFFSRKLCLFRSPCQLRINELISLDTSGGVFLENYFSLWSNIFNLTWWT